MLFRSSQYVKESIYCKFSKQFKHSCIIKNGSMIIDIFGNLYPCMAVVGQRDLIIGNVFSGYNEAKIRMLDNISMKPIKKCVGCSNYRSCNSVRCKYVNKSINNSYYEPSVINCHVQNINQHLMDKYKKQFKL